MTHDSIHSVSPQRLQEYAEGLIVDAAPERGFAADDSEAVRLTLRGMLAEEKAVARAEAALRKARLDRDAARATLAKAASALTRELRQRLPGRYGQATRHPRPLFAPERPTASLAPGGRLTLRWRRAGNPKGVTFVVERLMVDGSWQQVGLSGYAKLSLDGQEETPSGFFRVTAARSGELSLPSTVAIPKLEKPPKTVSSTRKHRRAA